VADVESDIKWDNGIEHLEGPDQWNESAAPIIPGQIRPTRKSKRQADKVLVTVNSIEMRMHKGLKKK